MFALGFSTILFELFKKVFYSKSFLMVVVGVVLAVVVGSKFGGIKETVGGWFGNKTVPELKAEISLKDETIKKLAEDNKQKDIQLEIQQDNHQATVDTIVVVTQKEKELGTKVDNVKNKKKEKVQEVKDMDLPIEEEIYAESMVIHESLMGVYREVCQLTVCEEV
jgi:ABC-type lipoprotein release transport system permease subunit